MEGMLDVESDGRGEYASAFVLVIGHALGVDKGVKDFFLPECAQLPDNFPYDFIHLVVLAHV
jgi:hypothetical protein